MQIETTLQEACKAFPGTRIVFVGRAAWAQLVAELRIAGRLRFLVLNKQGVRVLHDPALEPGSIEMVRVPAGWGPKEERKPRRKMSREGKC